MSRLCIDTSAYSHFQRGHPEAVEALDAAEWLGMPSVALGELHVGFALGGKRAQNEAQLREFLSNPIVTVLDVDPGVSRLYAEIVVELRRTGKPIPTNDIWIAATAARAGAAVLTYDPHFASISRIGAVILERQER